MLKKLKHQVPPSCLFCWKGEDTSEAYYNIISNCILGLKQISSKQDLKRNFRWGHVASLMA